jgi:DNA-directed RNA polymerase specialized sigma24 family protein
VLLSAQSRAPGCGSALSELYRIYWYPLYAYVRRRGHASEDARDLTQGFFRHLLEHKTLARADHLKGKFRSFLLGLLQNYLLTEADRARCLKRGGGMKFVALDQQDAEDRYKLEPVALLGEAMNHLRQEYAIGHNVATFETLKAFLEVGNGKEPPAYEQAAAALQVSVGAVKTLIHRLRKQYTASVREQIGRTVANPAEIDAEIHELCEALVVAEGWILP